MQFKSSFKDVNKLLLNKSKLLILNGNQQNINNNNNGGINCSRNFITDISMNSTRFVPKCNPVHESDLEKISQFVKKTQRLFVLSGAGISTESGNFFS